MTVFWKHSSEHKLGQTVGISGQKRNLKNLVVSKSTFGLDYFFIPGIKSQAV